jgi:hypothetical protein
MRDPQKRWFCSEDEAITAGLASSEAVTCPSPACAGGMAPGDTAVTCVFPGNLNADHRDGPLCGMASVRLITVMAYETMSDRVKLAREIAARTLFAVPRRGFVEGVSVFVSLS